MKSRGKVSIAVILAVALVGGLGLIAYNCGPQPIDLKLKQDNSTPSGTLQGRVADINTGAPLANVEVRTQVGGGTVSTKTDSKGFYSIGGLPAGQEFQVYYVLSGYSTRIEWPYIYEAVGEYDGSQNFQVPKGNSITIEDVDLYPANATLEVTVARNSNCGTTCTGVLPLNISGATVILDLTGSYDLYLSGTTDSSGKVTFTGLPADFDGLNIGSYRVLPYDCSGDGKADLRGASSGGVTLYNNGTTTSTITLATCI